MLAECWLYRAGTTTPSLSRFFPSADSQAVSIFVYLHVLVFGEPQHSHSDLSPSVNEVAALEHLRPMGHREEPSPPELPPTAQLCFHALKPWGRIYVFFCNRDLYLCRAKFHGGCWCACRVLPGVLLLCCMFPHATREVISV